MRYRFFLTGHLSFFLGDGDNFHNRKRVNDAVSATETIRYSFGSYKYTLVDDSESNSLARLIPKVSILFEVVNSFVTRTRSLFLPRPFL